MPKSEVEFLKHIHKECLFIEKALNGYDEEKFYEDEILKRAITRSLEIIGEASKRVSDEFKLKYHTIPWSYMAKMRDKIIHHYTGIDYEIVWQTIQNQIPELKYKIKEIINNNS